MSWLFWAYRRARELITPGRTWRPRRCGTALEAAVLLDDLLVGESPRWHDGRLLIVPRATAWQGLLLRQEPDGSLVVHADLRELAGGFNEIVVDGRGNIYLNGSDFDFLGWL